MRAILVALVLAIAVAFTGGPALAQQTPPGRGQQTPPPPGQLTPKPAPVAPGRATTPKPSWAPADKPPLQNVKLDLTITDTFGTSSKKTVTMLIADGFAGRIRSSNDVPVSSNSVRAITINIDAIPEIRSNGQILVTLTVEYVPDLSTMTQAGGVPKPANINESLTVLVADGKPTMISQSADPATDRRVTVEVTASIVK
jgi:hypothetical protein